MSHLRSTVSSDAVSFYRAEQNRLVIPVGRPGPSPSLSPYSAVSEDESRPSPRCDPGRTSRRVESDPDAVHIICRYDSPAPPPPAVDIGDLSSIVEIDGDCVIIHSRADEPAVSTPIQERCRRFYERRLRARRPAPVAVDDDLDSDATDDVPPSVDSGRESGTDSGDLGRERNDRSVKPKDRRNDRTDKPGDRRNDRTTKPGDGRKDNTDKPGGRREQSPAGPASSLEYKMLLLRREMCSLMNQDDDLFRQLLALSDSIEALKRRDASLSPASSLSSLPELAAESCSPSSTLSSHNSALSYQLSSPSSTLSSASSGRQSHLSSDSGNYTVIKSKFRSQPQLSAEERQSGAGERLFISQSSWDVTLPSLRQAAPASPHHLAVKPPAGGHKKQGSWDSGIVDQELREAS